MEEIIDQNLFELGNEQLREMSVHEVLRWVRDNVHLFEGVDGFNKKPTLPWIRFFSGSAETTERVSNPMTVDELLRYCTNENGVFVPDVFSPDFNRDIFVRVPSGKGHGVGPASCRVLNIIFSELGLIKYEGVKKSETFFEDEPRGFISIGKIYSIKIHLFNLLNKALREVGLEREISSRKLTMEEFKAVFDKDGYFDEEKLREALGKAVDNLVKNFRSTLLKRGYIDEDGKWRY